MTGGLIFTLGTTTWRKPAKPPSTRAIQNYNSISTTNDENINYTFIGEEDGIPNLNTQTLPSDFRFSRDLRPMTAMRKDMIISNNSLASAEMPLYLSNSNTNLGPESVASGFSETMTSADSERTDPTNMGSTAVLVQPKTKLVSLLIF